MAPTKPASNAKEAARAGPTTVRSYRRQPRARPGADGDDYDGASDTTHESRSRPRVAIASRTNDFSERTWWMVDVDGVGGSAQGATALVTRCMRAHGWDEPKARRILAAYRQFLTLKKHFEDWEARLLSPCHLVDQMWHQHVLDNFNYYHDMMLLCGHFVGHNPDGALDVEAKAKRDQFTRECLRQHFETYDITLWDGVGIQNGNRGTSTAGANERSLANGETVTGNGGDGEDENGPAERVMSNAGIANRGGQNGIAAGNGANGHLDDEHSQNPFTLRIKDQMGEETMFRVRITTRMSKVFHAYAMRKRIDVQRLYFVIDGERVGPHETPTSLGLEEYDQIDCILAQCGC